MIDADFDRLATGMALLQAAYGERPRNKEAIFRSIVDTFCYACAEYDQHLCEEHGCEKEEVYSHKKWQCERCMFGPWGKYDEMKKQLKEDTKDAD